MTEPSIDASAGVANIMDTIETVPRHYNPELEVLGVVLNKVPPRSGKANFRAAELGEALGDRLLDPAVPYADRPHRSPAVPAVRSTRTASRAPI
ncbi:hypothetical protein GS909_18605 [Rhodococcus hoagii]|nr:hypothetical protein [Prescottella equi]